MALTQEQILQIENILKDCLRKKIRNYKPETAVMPFHIRLLGKDRMALFSFIQSINTVFGTSIFESVAIILAGTNFQSATIQQVAGKEISSESQIEIQNILDNLTTATSEPNKKQEIEAIRAVCRKGEMRKVKLTKVDVRLTANDGTIFLIDVKTAKPNIGEFKGYKRTLLEWVAVTLAADPVVNVQSLLAIPYNPYEPKPYNRWTLRGMVDLKQEILVGEEFWDFLGGKGSYLQVLDVFERVGIELRQEIDEYFSRFKK